MEYITNPLTGRKIRKHGLIYNKLLKNGILEQHGGNPILAALPTLSQLVIPAGLAMASYCTGKYINKDQQGGYSGSGGSGGSGCSLIDSPILQNWTTENHVMTLQPNTLIPAGILVASYNQYSGESVRGNTVYQQLQMIVEVSDLKQYMTLHGLVPRTLTPHTKLPFAILMGPQVFKQYLIDEL
jgi:hypothetical protein